MAKIVDEVQAEADGEVQPLNEHEPEMDDNKENQCIDNTNSVESEIIEAKADARVDVPPSIDIDKVTSDLMHSRTELLGRVQNLKKDLQEWRGKLDSQVKTYRQELGELRTTLNSEVEQLRNEFQALRTTLKKQLDATTGFAELGSNSAPEKASV